MFIKGFFQNADGPHRRNSHPLRASVATPPGTSAAQPIARLTMLSLFNHLDNYSLSAASGAHAPLGSRAIGGQPIAGAGADSNDVHPIH